jgi:hypothetical protein
LLIGIQSPDTIQYLAIDLQPGYYALLCLVGDPEQGSVVHALEGMIDVVAAAASIRSKVAGHGNDRPEGRSSAVPRLGWISAGQRLTRRCATPRGRM